MHHQHTILLVDDDLLLRKGLLFHLERAGYTAYAAGGAEEALALANEHPPDLVLLDIGLPGLDGLDALPLFRRAFHAPVFFLTARRRNLDEVLGLQLGADDYITKPFDTDVLLARIKVALRRVTTDTPTPTRVLHAGDVAVDTAARSVTVGKREVELAPREFDLLQALVQRAGVTVSREDLLREVWGPEFAGEPQVLYVHIRWLREKLEADPCAPQRIVTVHGIGYRFDPQSG